MAPTTIASELRSRARRVAGAAARAASARNWKAPEALLNAVRNTSVAKGGSPLPKSRVETLEAQVANLTKERDKVVARSAILEEQRDRHRYSTYALTVLAKGLDLDFDPSTGAKNLRRALRQLEAEARLAHGLLHGKTLDEAIVQSVRALLTNPQSVARARALCTALMNDERTRPGATVALGYYLLVWGSRKNAYEQFSQAPVDLIVRAAARDAVACALRVDPPAGKNLARQVIDHPELTPADAFAVAGILAGHHDLRLSRRALARAQSGVETLDEITKKDVERLQQWLDEHPAELDTPAPPRQRPALGLIHYDHPHYERSSSNIGDYTQTVAVLGHVLRRRGLTLHIEDAELEGALDTLRSAISPDLMLDTPATEVDLIPVSRDASRWEALPEPTWTIAFGWYMHPIFGVRTDLPFHPGVRPIFLSFHINKIEVLTPEAVEYLKRYGPIGCRDWTTVDLLMSHGVDAFFSGCVTTTTHITAGCRKGHKPSGKGVGHVDTLSGARDLTQASTDMNDRTLPANLLAAHQRHLEFRDSFESLQTSRLHVYLPATSMGVPVEFEPRNMSDVRFDGLSGLTPDSTELRAIQDRITGLLDLVLGLMTSGADEEIVYKAWREHCRPLVEQARARREHWRTTLPPVESLAGAAAPVRESAVHMGEGGDVHLAIALDQNLVDEAPVVLQGIDEHTHREVQVHVLTRGVPTETVESWARAFPRLRFSHYCFDDVEYGEIGRLLAHTTVSTMDRLLLPDVLADLDRVVYIDIDVTVLGDVGELWDLDLRGAPLAARPTASEWAESGLAFVYRAAYRLPADLAREFRALMHARVTGDFTSFNAGILVLDLDRMRADKFSENFAGMAGRYGLNDQDVLCCYAGAEAQPLDARWNAFPTREAIPEDVRLVHFAGGAKPWQSLPIPVKDRWLAARERYCARLAASETLVSTQR
jgi:lipopolysaccharide biosynthesis glycosyltransferase